MNLAVASIYAITLINPVNTTVKNGQGLGQILGEENREKMGRTAVDQLQDLIKSDRHLGRTIAEGDQFSLVQNQGTGLYTCKIIGGRDGKNITILFKIDSPGNIVLSIVPINQGPSGYGTDISDTFSKEKPVKEDVNVSPTRKIDLGSVEEGKGIRSLLNKNKNALSGVGFNGDFKQISEHIQSVFENIKNMELLLQPGDRVDLIRNPDSYKMIIGSRTGDIVIDFTVGTDRDSSIGKVLHFHPSMDGSYTERRQDLN